MVSEFDLNAEELDLFSEDNVRADLYITPSLMQRIEDRAAKFKVDDVPRELVANTGLYDKENDIATACQENQERGGVGVTVR